MVHHGILLPILNSRDLSGKRDKEGNRQLTDIPNGQSLMTTTQDIMLCRANCVPSVA